MSFQLLTLATAAAGLGLVGIVYNSDAAYFMCSALLAVILISFVSTRLSAHALAWRREVLDRVYEGDPFRVRLEAVNRSRIPLFLVRVSDALPEHVRAIESPRFLLPALWPGESVTMSYGARAAKRGVFALGPIRVSVSDPFGVFQRFVGVALAGEAVIYPRPLPLLTDLEQGGADLRGAISGNLSLASDSGMEFYGVRDYQPGDELRRIHWPATAHHGKISVIEFERGTSGSVVVILDTRLGSEYGRGAATTLETAVQAAASLVHWALNNEGLAGLAFDTAADPRWHQAEYVAQESELLEALAWARAEGRLPVSTLAEWIGPRLPTGAAVFLVTASPDPHLPSLARWLADAHARVTVLLIDPSGYGGPEGPVDEMAATLRGMGAHVATYHRNEDLREFLDYVLLGRG